MDGATAAQQSSSWRESDGRSSISLAVEDTLRHRLGHEQTSRLELGREKEALFTFCQVFKDERSFSKLTYHPSITKLFQALQCERVCEEWVVGGSDVEHVRCVLMTIRLLLRDELYQDLFRKEERSMISLAKCFSIYAEAYLRGSHQSLNSLREMSNIFQKVSSNESECLLESCQEVVQWMVQLLSSRDQTLLQSCLCAIINSCRSGAGVDWVTSLSPLPPLLLILQFSDPVSRQKSSDLLLLLISHSPTARENLRDLDGLSTCLRLLHSEDMHILHRMVCVVERLSEDQELRDDFRLLGGVPLILSLLSCSKSSSYGGGEKLVAVKSAVCSTITQLAVNDTNSLHFTQENGVYLLSRLILPGDRETESYGTLQRNAWRALRYLYSCERNRRKFQKLFPPKLFEMFIDVGHYIRDSSAYAPLVLAVHSLTEPDLRSLQIAIEESSSRLSPLFTVGGYSGYELLGSGAFGNVYKVKKDNSDHFLAMKEIKSSLPLLGTTPTDRTSSIGKIMNEVNIVREQLHHPNVVLYHKCFEEGGHLYIVMELIEGAPLSDIITSLADKRERFEEDRIWRIFTQLALALRYLHKEKKVVHRDLKPSNLMLGDCNRLTITDFGLAKQKEREFSVMESIVGTLSYWCPELVKNEPYTEKADIWAAGCILYQMATLQVPFHTNNILTLAKKIAEVSYPPIPDGLYSTLLPSIVSRCLTGDVEGRPDSVELGSLLAGHLMVAADQLASSRDLLQRRLERERQRSLRHQQRYHQLVSQATPTSQEATPTYRRGSSAGSSRRRPSESLISTSSPNSPFTRSTPHRILNTSLEPHPPIGMDWGLEYSPVLFHRGVGSMESGLEWEGDTSENVFPEQPMTSSPGNITSFHGDAFSATPSVGVKRESPRSSRLARGRSYSAVIPRHHSGRGHSSSVSESGRSLPGGGVVKPESPLRYRASSSSGVLSLSSRHLREVTDPISQLLGTLHRLLSLTLTPSHSHSSRLLLLDKYQRSLFHSDVSPDQIKGELHRLSTRSNEGVWLVEEGVWSVGPRLLKKAIEEISGTLNPSYTSGTLEPSTLTYDLLAAIIDSLHNEQAKRSGNF